MKQQLIVGAIFLVGLVIGTMISAYYTGNYVTEVVRTVPETENVTPHAQTPSAPSRVNTLHEAYLTNITRELMQLRKTVTELKAAKNNNTIVYVQHPTSHKEVENLDRKTDPLKPVTFLDGHYHKDDDHVAQQLYSKVRVLCWIMTSPSNLHAKAIHVKNTWGKRCNKLLFMSDTEDTNFPAIGLGTEPGRDHLTAKTMRAFDYVHKHHSEDADWFLKADDDTYVIVENLRYMLSAHAPTEAVYFGKHFKVIVKQGYFSGGAGYVLSKEALGRFSKRGGTTCRQDQGAEDAEMGHCMERLGVTTGDSRDKMGRSRFHPFNPETHLHGNYPDWYRQYDKYGAKQGVESMSDYPVSFHYVSINQMYDLEYYVYHLGTYGIVRGLQDLNGPPQQQPQPQPRKSFITTTRTSTKATAPTFTTTPASTTTKDVPGQ